MNKPNDIRGATEREGLAGLFTLAALLSHSMDQGLADQGLTRARGEVLWTLHHQGAMTQRALSQALDCSAPNVTGLLDALQAAGFVIRQPHPSDRRATLVTLTQRGKTTVSAWTTGYDQLAGDLFADLATPELGTFVAGLNRVLGRLRDAVPKRPGDTG